MSNQLLTFSSSSSQTKLDGDRLLDDLEHSLSRPTAFDCVMRVRASTGLRPTGFYGSFFMSNTTDIELGNIDTDKAIAVEIKHDDKLREDENAFFQVSHWVVGGRGQIFSGSALDSVMMEHWYACSHIPCPWSAICFSIA